MFRDDHHAAVARAKALERELAGVRRELGKQTRRVAKLEERLSSLDRPMVASEAPASARPVRLPARARWWVRLAAAIFFGGFVGVVAVRIWVEYRWSRSHEIPGRVCTLRTEPPGADVYSTRAARETRLGTTPLEMNAARWLVVEQEGLLVARKPGHEEIRVWSPWNGGGCDDHVFAMGLSR